MNGNRYAKISMVRFWVVQAGTYCNPANDSVHDIMVNIA